MTAPQHRTAGGETFFALNQNDPVVHSAILHEFMMGDPKQIAALLAPGRFARDP
jgi:hypothetical protein